MWSMIVGRRSGKRENDDDAMKSKVVGIGVEELVLKRCSMVVTSPPPPPSRSVLLLSRQSMISSTIVSITTTTNNKVCVPSIIIIIIHVPPDEWNQELMMTMGKQQKQQYPHLQWSSATGCRIKWQREERERRQYSTHHDDTRRGDGIEWSGVWCNDNITPSVLYDIYTILLVSLFTTTVTIRRSSSDTLLLQSMSSSTVT